MIATIARGSGAALLIAWSSLAMAQACPAVALKVNHVAAVAAPDQDWLTRELRNAIDKVCAWWGGTFTQTLFVDVTEARGPSMALVPAWRGQRGHMTFPALVVRRHRAATIHEVTHVFAPNGNRFLAEGLAVFAHEHLGGPAAHPNFGRNLHAAARPHANTDIAALDRLATPARLEIESQISDQDAYLVAGSFVRFLIERHGLEKFRRLYATTPLVPGQRNAGSPVRWQDVYGVPLERLTTEWRTHL